MTHIYKTNKPYFSRINFSEISFNAILILLGFIIVFLIVLIKSKTASDFWRDPLLYLYTIFVTVFQLSRIVSAMLYKNSVSEITSTENVIENSIYEPKVTFVIPCKNEEKNIAKTISNCFQADYPKNKLEVVIINDGSTDDTIKILRDISKKYQNFIIVDWKANRGKRYAMAEGIRRASGDVIIQLDSDSHIEPKTFRNLIKPFRNPEIGAVCAHSEPDNTDTNLITKMQAAYYFVSFRILKAAESTFLSVFCCSGCCSAYRKDIILPILDKWLAEKFLGRPITWGDDRALTNWVLKLNYSTIYTDQVKAYTIVPNTLNKFLRQQVRWKKGWFVNSLFASRFIIKREPFVAFSYFFPLIVVTFLTPFIAARALIYNPIFRDISPLFYIFGIFLVACIFTVYYRYIARNNKYWPYVFVWSAINLIFLSFVLIYALVTIQNRKWGTR